MNSKEENSSDFCLNYVQEFGLWSRVHARVVKRGCFDEYTCTLDGLEFLPSENTSIEPRHNVLCI